MVDAINDLDDMLDNVDENGKHRAQVTAIRFQNGKDGRNWLIFKFEITDADDPVEGAEYERWTQDWSHLSVSDYDALSGKEKANVRTAKRRVLENLLAVGFSEDEAKEIRRNPKSELRQAVKGRMVWITVQVSENNGKVFKNVTDIQLMRDDDGNESNPPF